MITLFFYLRTLMESVEANWSEYNKSATSRGIFVIWRKRWRLSLALAYLTSHRTYFQNNSLLRDKVTVAFWVNRTFERELSCYLGFRVTDLRRCTDSELTPDSWLRWHFVRTVIPKAPTKIASDLISSPKCGGIRSIGLLLLIDSLKIMSSRYE